MVEAEEKDDGGNRRTDEDIPSIFLNLVRDEPESLKAIQDRGELSDEALAELAIGVELMQRNISARKQMTLLLVAVVLLNVLALPITFMAIVKRFFPETAAKVRKMEEGRTIDKR